VYSPTGDNRGRDALNHSEVISITAEFLSIKETLRRVLVGKYPVLLIDESQDAIRDLMDALLEVQERHEANFCLGLFGDTMQRIYGHGKADLERSIPVAWARLQKLMNHRCPDRIVRLLNRIRADVDGLEQRCRLDKPAGDIRLFVLSQSTQDKSRAESWIMRRMAEISHDPEWDQKQHGCKALTLEHHMAARRLGVARLHEPLYAVDRLRMGLLDSTLPGIRFFTKNVLPLVEAMHRGDRFAAASVVRKHSPLLDSKKLKAAAAIDFDLLLNARVATDGLMTLWEKGTIPTFLDVLRSIAASGLFEIPEILRPIVERQKLESTGSGSADDEGSDDKVLAAWDKVMPVPFELVAEYDRYVEGQSPFGTHQGVKDLQFFRVMVIVDDEDAKGFLFSYDKLFGVKEKSDADKKNEKQGSETSIDRTRRLFYVTCSRAERSLAVIAY
jgi:DNA helicase-2/ATP-dependent DNA helicase PcrA